MSLDVGVDRVDVAVVLADQRRMFDEHRRTLELQTASLDARVRQAREEIGARESRLGAMRRQLASIVEELSIVAGAAERGHYPRNKLRALERERARLEGEVGRIGGEIARLGETIAEHRQQILQAGQRLREEAGRELAEVRGRIANLNEQIRVAEDALSRVEVHAYSRRESEDARCRHPTWRDARRGRADRHVGDVVGQVSSLDVQSVAIGQKAEIRFPAFSSRNTPPLYGRVETVSADAIQEEGTRESYFATRVAVDVLGVPEEMLRRLTPGMPADVLIITGERTLLDYLIGPIRDR